MGEPNKGDYSCEIMSFPVLAILSALSHFWFIIIAICIGMLLWVTIVLLGQLMRSVAGTIPSVLKAAFIVGGSYGRGAMICRGGKTPSGGWGIPAMMVLVGGSVGFQIGGEAADFELLIMNEHAKTAYCIAT
jgi:hypothetical protein